MLCKHKGNNKGTHIHLKGDSVSQVQQTEKCHYQSSFKKKKKREVINKKLKKSVIVCLLKWITAFLPSSKVYCYSVNTNFELYLEKSTEPESVKQGNI
jgi:hypothetical protein